MAKISKDYLDNFGKVPISPWLSGEQAHHTSTVVQGGAKRDKIEGPGERTWAEPDTISPSRSMNTVVFQAKNGGNSVVINDEGSDGDGYMLITHNTGTVVQIDQHGTVFIKSFGDTYNTTEGIMYQRSDGDTNQNVGGDWNVKVEGGSNNVFVQGDVNIECENYNLEVRGKATINAAEALELRGAKVSIEAHSTDIDVAAAENVRLGALSGRMSFVSEADMVLNTNAILNAFGKSQLNIGSEGMIGIKNDGAFNVNSGGNIDMLSGGTSYLDGKEVRLGENGGAGSVVPAQPELPKMPKLKDPEARRPSQNSEAGVSTVYPSPSPHTDRLGDDT